MDSDHGLIPILGFAIERARAAHADSSPPETLQFWHELINEAREAKRRCSRFEAAAMRELDRLIGELGRELERLPQPGPRAALRLDPA